MIAAIAWVSSFFSTLIKKRFTAVFLYSFALAVLTLPPVIIGPTKIYHQILIITKSWWFSPLTQSWISSFLFISTVLPKPSLSGLDHSLLRDWWNQIMYTKTGRTFSLSDWVSLSVFSMVWRGRILVTAGEGVNLIGTFWMIILICHRKLKHVSFDALLHSRSLS